jgi:hypothetical protein
MIESEICERAQAQHKRASHGYSCTTCLNDNKTTIKTNINTEGHDMATVALQTCMQRPSTASVAEWSRRRVMVPLATTYASPIVSGETNVAYRS